MTFLPLSEGAQVAAANEEALGLSGVGRPAPDAPERPGQQVRPVTEVLQLPALRRCCGRASRGPSTAEAGEGFFRGVRPPWTHRPPPKPPTGLWIVSGAHTQLRRPRPQPPAGSAPPSRGTLGQGWAPVKLTDDKDRGRHGRIPQGSAGGPLRAVCSFSKSAFCGNYILKTAFQNFLIFVG